MFGDLQYKMNVIQSGSAYLSMFNISILPKDLHVYSWVAAFLSQTCICESVSANRHHQLIPISCDLVSHRCVFTYKSIISHNVTIVESAAPYLLGVDGEISIVDRG